MKKLTIVVNCTDRKSVVPEAHLRVGSLPTGDMDERFSAWRCRVEAADRLVELSGLYMGEAWLQAKALAGDVRARGTSVRMVVASAGLGLREVTHRAPAYAATFSSGHVDSVTDKVNTMADWWVRLGGLPQTASMPTLEKEPVLLVLSESYARAMDADLVKLAERGGNHLLVGGWRTIDGLSRLPADRNLRQALGGTVSSLSLRMARRWMAQQSGAELYNSGNATQWSQWARTARRSERYMRAPLTDDELTAVIHGVLNEQSPLSATRALRIVRDRGIACEQKRFGALFQEVVSRR